jgi:hypothetical protein
MKTAVMKLYSTWALYRVRNRAYVLVYCCVKRELSNYDVISQEKRRFHAYTILPFLLIDNLGIEWFLLNTAA